MTDLTDFRTQKDHFFGHSPQSPLTPAQQDGFEGLNYFDEAPNMIFEVELELFDEQDVVIMQTNAGREVEYTRWGRFVFEMEGEGETHLTVYAVVGAGGFFLPFKDETNGSETYPAGRYVEVEPLGGEVYLVDFNKAYNPYCAYNDNWVCPIPPAENHLRIPIRAGEKTFK